MTTPPAVRWSVREQSNGRQGCRECSANISVEPRVGSRVAAGRRQVQRGPPAGMAARDTPVVACGGFAAVLPTGTIDGTCRAELLPWACGRRRHVT